MSIATHAVKTPKLRRSGTDWHPHGVIGLPCRVKIATSTTLLTELRAVSASKHACKKQALAAAALFLNGGFNSMRYLPVFN